MEKLGNGKCQLFVALYDDWNLYNVSIGFHQPREQTCRSIPWWNDLLDILMRYMAYCKCYCNLYNAPFCTALTSCTFMFNTSWRPTGPHMYALEDVYAIRCTLHALSLSLSLTYGRNILLCYSILSLWHTHTHPSKLNL